MQARKIAKAPQAAAQFAQGEAQRQRQERGPPGLRRGGEGTVHERAPQAAAASACVSIAAGAQAHDAVAALGQVEIVGDEHQGGAAIPLQGEQQVDDGVAGRLVEIAGRLVGDEDRRVGHDGAGDGDALLLAARKLGRVVVQTLAESHCAQARVRRARTHRPQRRRARAAARRFPAPSWSARDGRTGTRCRCAGRGSGRARPRRGPRGRCPSTTTRPESGRSSPAMVISSVDLPEPDGPTRPTASPRPILKEDALQDMNPRGAAAEAQIEVFEDDGLVGHAGQSDVSRGNGRSRRRRLCAWKADGPVSYGGRNAAPT